MQLPIKDQKPEKIIERVIRGKKKKEECIFSIYVNADNVNPEYGKIS
mgnify:CR=1 FL=1